MRDGNDSHAAHRLNGLIAEFYGRARTAPPEEHKEQALAVLKSVLPFDSAKWGTGRFEDGQPIVHSMHLHNLPEENMVRYRETGFARDDHLLRAIGKSPGRAVRITDLWTLEDWLKTDVYRCYASHFGIVHGMSICTEDEVTGLIHATGLYRSDLTQPFTDGERGLLELLAPHIHESNKLARFIHLRQTGSKAGARTDAVGICDRFGLLYETERQFTNLLHLEWPRWHGGRLPQPLREAVAAHRRAYQGLRIAVKIDFSGELPTLHARECSPLDALAPRQRQIAQHLSEGKTYKEIAQDLGLSASTVTNHANAIYRKLGVSGKVQLVNLIGR